MKGQTLYVRVVPQDKDRGYAMLVGWQKPLVKRNADYESTMGGITRAMIDSYVERFRKEFYAERVEDITDESLKKRFRKQFGEEVVAETPQVDNTQEV
jgi:hypothetical protein